MGGYTDDQARLASIRLSLPESIKETAQKFDPMPVEVIPATPSNPLADPVILRTPAQTLPAVDPVTVGPDLVPVRFTEWTWFWRCMDGEYIGPKSESKESSLVKFYDYKRPRPVLLRTWITEHRNRYKSGTEVGLGMNNFTRTFWLFRNGRYSERKRRWVLSPPVGNDYEKFDDILRASQDMPQDLARQSYMVDEGQLPRQLAAWDEAAFWGSTDGGVPDWAWSMATQMCQSFGAMETEEREGGESEDWSGTQSQDGDWGWDAQSSTSSSSLGPSASQCGGSDYAAYDGWQAPWQAPPSTAWQAQSSWDGWGSSQWPAPAPSPAPQQWLEQDSNDDGGNSDDDQRRAEAFLQMRKANRAYKKATGAKGKGPPAGAGGGYQPWWDGQPQSSPPFPSNLPDKGKGKMIKGSKKGGKSFPCSRPKGKGKFKGKFGKGRGKAMLAAVAQTLAGFGVHGLLVVVNLAFPDITPLLLQALSGHWNPCYRESARMFMFERETEEGDLVVSSPDLLLEAHVSERREFFDYPFEDDEHDIDDHREFFDYRELDFGSFGSAGQPVESLNLDVFDKTATFPTQWWHTMLRWLGSFHIVGRESSARRGILMDTGASVGLHGKTWRQAITDEVWTPCGVVPKTGESKHGMVIGGAGGKADGVKVLLRVPAAILAYTPTNVKKIIYMTMGSHQIDSDCPALGAYEMMVGWDADVKCRVPPYMLVTWAGERLRVPLVGTDSGHLVLPIDNWNPKTAAKDALGCSLHFYSSSALVKNYFQGPFHGLGDDEQPNSGTPLIQLEDFLQDSSTLKAAPLVNDYAFLSLERGLPVESKVAVESATRSLLPFQTRMQKAHEFWAYANERKFSLLASDGNWVAWPSSNATPPWMTDAIQTDILGRPTCRELPTGSWDFWQVPALVQDPTARVHLMRQLRCGPPIDSTTGWRLDLPTHTSVLLKAQQTHSPMFLLISVIPRTGKEVKNYDSKIRHEMSLLDWECMDFYADLVEAQSEDGHWFACFVPAGSRLLEHDAMPRIASCSRDGEGRVFHTCAHGLLCSETGLPIKKPMLVYSNAPLYEICRECPGLGQHPHHKMVRGADMGIRESLWCVGLLRTLTREVGRLVSCEIGARRQEHDHHAGPPTRVQRYDEDDDDEVQIDWCEPTILCAHGNLSFPVIKCRRCIARAKGQEYTAPHTRAKGCLLRNLPFKSPSRPWVKAKALAKGKAPPVLKGGKMKGPPAPKKPVAPKPPKKAPPPAAGHPLQPKNIAKPPPPPPPEVSMDDPSDEQLRAEALAQPADPSLREEGLARSSDPQLRQFMEGVVTVYGKGLNEVGSTRFLVIDDQSKALTSPDLDSEHLEAVKRLADPRERYSFKSLQLVRQPKTRRLPTPQLPLDQAPWRYTFLLLGSGQIVQEPWTRIFGPGSVTFPPASFVRLKPAWGLFVHANLMVPDAPQQSEHDRVLNDLASKRLSEEMSLMPDDKMPISIGKLNRLLSSPSRKFRLVGIRQMHEKFGHASTDRMKKALDRAGHDIDEAEIRHVFDQCRACRLWAIAPSNPQASLSSPVRENREVEGDFVFYEGQAIWHFVDRFQRFERGQLTTDKSLEAVLPVFGDYIGLFKPKERLYADQEGCLRSPEAGIYVGRRGTELHLVPKTRHLGMSDEHGKLLKDIMHRIQTAAELEGLRLEIREIHSEAQCAKNMVLEFGDFPPAQCRLGTNPTWERAMVFEDEVEAKHPFARGFRPRELGGVAAQQAIHQYKIQRAGKGRAPPLTLAQVIPGTEVECRVKSSHKDIPSR